MFPGQRLAARRTMLVVVLVAASAKSCGRASPATSSVAASSAYSDGFEVVVFDMRDGIPSNVRSVGLTQAEQAIAAGSQASMPVNPVVIQQQLSTGKSGDSRVVITTKPLDAGKQQVRLAFHESSRTFVYEYVVEGAKVTPLSSEYRDVGKSKVVRYSGEE